MTKTITRKQYLEGFYKILFSLAVPIILQNLMQTFVNMLDTIMVGRLGSVEIAAVGLGNQIYFMLSMVSFGVSSGCAIFVSQFWGQNNIKGIRHTTGIMLLACGLCSIVFCILAFCVPELLLGFYSKDPAVIERGIPYLKIVAFSYPLTAISFAYQMSFRATEHVYLPMVCTAVSLVLNVILNTLLIFGISVNAGSLIFAIPAMGVAGAALATLICRVVEFLIVVIYSYSRKFEACGSFKELLGFDSAFVWKVFKTAFPVLISETMWGFGITVQNAIFARSGTDAIAAYNITNTISQLTWVFFIGMGNASAIILGKKIGARDFEGAKAYVYRFTWFMPLAGAIIGLLLFPLSRVLPYFFNVDFSIIQIARSMIYVLMSVYALRAFNMLLIVGVCRAGGDTIFSLLIDSGFMWAASIPLGVCAAFLWNWPPYAIMLMLESEQVLKMVFGLWRIYTGKWLHVLTDEKSAAV